MNTILLPVQLRQLSGGREHLKFDLALTVKQEDRTLRLLIDLLEGEAPGIKTRLLDQEGNLRRFINVFIDADDARIRADKQRGKPKADEPPLPDVNPLDCRLSGFEEISILPAIAGG